MVLPKHHKVIPDTDLVLTDIYTNNAAAIVAYGSALDLKCKDRPELVQRQIPCAADFQSTMCFESPSYFKNGTLTAEVIYKNAVGTLTIQDSVNGWNFRTVNYGGTDAVVTLTDSGTEQSQAMKISIGALAGTWLRCVWDGADGASPGYICINIA